MKSRILCAVCIAVGLAMSAQAGDVPSLPSVDISVEPMTPTTADNIAIVVSGLWPDTCVPEQIHLATFAGDSIRLDVLLPGWDDPAACSSLSCDSEPTPFEVEGTIGKLAAGRYDIYARVISCEGRGRYEYVSSIEVAEGKPSDTACDGCQASRFTVGGRVVLLTDDPPGGLGLKAGHVGTVICRDCTSGCGRLLVSWDLWTEGNKNVDGCITDTPFGFPSTSGLWVDLQHVLVGRPFDRTGTIQKGLEGCLTFVTDRGAQYNVVAAGNIHQILEEIAGMSPHGRIRLQGLLNDTQPRSDTIQICPQWNGNIYHPIVSACRDLPSTGPGACNLNLMPGDRVQLLVDQPLGGDSRPAVGLYAGTMGTVICTDSTDDVMPLYVSWDDWTGGTNTDYYCDSSVVPYPADSGWWMRCSDIRLVRRADEDE